MNDGPNKEQEQENYVIIGEKIAENLLEELSPEEQIKAIEVTHKYITNVHLKAVNDAKDNLERFELRLRDFQNNDEVKKSQ